MTFAVKKGDERHHQLCRLLECDGHKTWLTQSLDGVAEGQVAVAPRLTQEEKAALEKAGAQYVEYQALEECVLAHAAITAENAIGIAIASSSKTLFDSRILVVGFGRIGRQLARMLRGMGCRAAVSARRAEDLAEISIIGCRPVETRQLRREIGGFDLVINTVPSLVLGREVLERAADGTFIIDLASAPGGTDFDAAGKIGLRAVQALALPGKMTPVSSAMAIRRAVYSHLGIG